MAHVIETAKYVGLEWQDETAAPTAAEVVQFLEHAATTKQRVGIEKNEATGEQVIYVEKR